MGLIARDIVLWLLGVRGHIPRFDDFRPTPPAARPADYLHGLGVIVVLIAALSLVLSLSVWLAIRLI